MTRASLVPVPTDRQVWRHFSTSLGNLPKRGVHQIGRIRNPKMAPSGSAAGIPLSFEIVNQAGRVSFWSFNAKEAELLLIDAKVSQADQLSGLLVDLFKKDELTEIGFSFRRF